MEAPVFRARVLARSVFIDLTGYLILMLNGPFGVVLQAYAMLFLLALPLVKCSTKKLAAISAISFVVCPPLMLIGMSLLEGVALLDDIAGGTPFRTGLASCFYSGHGPWPFEPP